MDVFCGSGETRHQAGASSFERLVECWRRLPRKRQSLIAEESLTKGGLFAPTYHNPLFVIIHKENKMANSIFWENVLVSMTPTEKEIKEYLEKEAQLNDVLSKIK